MANFMMMESRSSKKANSRIQGLGLRGSTRVTRVRV